MLRETLCWHFISGWFFNQKGFRSLFKGLTYQPGVAQLRQKLNREAGEDRNGQWKKRAQLSKINTRSLWAYFWHSVFGPEGAIWLCKFLLPSDSLPALKASANMAQPPWDQGPGRCERAIKNELLVPPPSFFAPELHLHSGPCLRYLSMCLHWLRTLLILSMIYFQVVHGPIPFLWTHSL